MKTALQKIASVVFQSILFLGLGLLAFWFLIVSQF
jgi:hypothetical protein